MMDKALINEFETLMSNTGKYEATYTEIEKLATTHFSTVYLVKDQSNSFYVSKRIAASNTQNMEEYLMLKTLNHPSLPIVYDVIEDLEYTTVILEYLPGETLTRLVEKTGPIDLKKLEIIVAQLTDVLNYLHLQGKIHRDIKPDNIMIYKDKVWLIDFNAARIIKEHNTRDTYILGTHGFAAPEQYGFSQSDAKADIYALGATIYYALSGQKLSDNVTDTVAQSQMDKGWKKIILKCLAFNPNHRFHSVKALQKEVNCLKKDWGKVILRTSLLAIALVIVGAGSWQLFHAINDPKTNANMQLSNIEQVEPKVESSTDIANTSNEDQVSNAGIIAIKEPIVPKETVEAPKRIRLDDNEASPKIILSGTIDSIYFDQDRLDYLGEQDDVSIIYIKSVGGIQLNCPQIEGWDKGLVAQIQVYEGDQLVKTMYQMLTSPQVTQNNSCLFFFATPEEHFTKLNYALFQTNDYFVEEIMKNGPIEIHHFKWEDREQALQLIKNAAYVYTQPNIDYETTFTDLMWKSKVLINELTIYPDKEPYIDYRYSTDGSEIIHSNLYKGKEIEIQRGSDFTWEKTNTWDAYVSKMLNGDRFSYTLIWNTTRKNPFIVRDKDFKVTDLIFFSE